MEIKKRRTNGYGGSFADIHVIVKKPHDILLVEAGWKMIGETEQASVFGYTCRNRYQGDDETIVFELWGDLPAAFDKEQFSIDWQESTY